MTENSIAFAVIMVHPQPDFENVFKAAGFTPQPSQQTSDIHTIDTERYEANGVGDTDNMHQHLRAMNAAMVRGRSCSPAAIAGPEILDRVVAVRHQIALRLLRREMLLAYENDLYTIPSSGGEMQRVASHKGGNDPPAFVLYGSSCTLPGTSSYPASHPTLVAAAIDGSSPRTVYRKIPSARGSGSRRSLQCPGPSAARSSCPTIVRPSPTRAARAHATVRSIP